MSKSIYNKGKRSLKILKVNDRGAVLLTFYTWGPHRTRDSSGAARGLPHGQPFIWEGKGPTRAQDKVIRLGAGIRTACYFSGLQDSRVKAGSWFQHSLSAKSYRLFSVVSGPSFTQLTALHKAVMMEKTNQPDILLCKEGAKSGSPQLNLRILPLTAGRWTARCSDCLMLGMDHSHLWSHNS